MDARPDRPPAADAAALERLRTHRVRADRARGLGEELTAFVRGVRKVSAQAGRAGEAWGVVAPDAVAASTRVTELRAGTLVVEARSAADRHAADRWLRSGGLAELRANARAPITRVRFVLRDDGWDA
jgi:hypothetical protein